MSKVMYKYIIIVLVFYGSASIFDQVNIDHPSTAFIAGLVLIIINMLIKPLLWLVTLPVNIITFGLFSFVINAWMIMLMDWMVGGIEIQGFWYAALMALLITLGNSIFIEANQRERRRRQYR